MKKLNLGIVVVALIAFVSINPCMAKGKRQGGQTGSLPVLSQAEIEGLILMRVEEKLARDVYLTLFDTWGLPIFENIADSEQRHMDAIKNLLDKYGIEDPIEDPGGRGGFEDLNVGNHDFENLYEDLTAAGNQTVNDALIVGATIEDLDIYDLENLLEETVITDITNVYENLVKGSRNHLRAFVDQLVQRGESYEAQFLTVEEMDAILNTPKERGNR